MQAVGLFTLSCPGFQCLYQKPLSVTSLCVCSWARVRACVCMHVSHQRSVSGDIPEETSTFFFETKSHTGTWYFPGKLGRLIDQQAPGMSPPPQYWDYKCLPPFLFCFVYFMWVVGIELVSSWFPNKYLADWVISLANFHICQMTYSVWWTMFCIFHM